MAVRNAQAGSSSAIGAANNESRKGMVLPFQPLPLAFNHVNYYVDMPAVSFSVLIYLQHPCDNIYLCFVLSKI